MASPFYFGQQIQSAAMNIRYLIAYGFRSLSDRWAWDTAYPNDWRDYGRNVANTGVIRFLTGVDPNNQTSLDNSNGVTCLGISITQVATPATPTITNVGTAGATTDSYKIVARNGFGATLGTTPASAAGSTTTANATLSATNYNVVTFAKVSGASFYDIYRTTAAGTPSTTGKIGTVTSSINIADGTQTSTYTFNDTGIAADGTTAPTTNTTGFFSAPGAAAPPVLGTPVGGVATVGGTAGSTTITYKIVAKAAIGTSAASGAITTTTANATLSTTNKVTVTWNPVPGASSYDVYRTAAGGTPSSTGLLGNVLASAALSFVDTGIAGDSSTPPSTNTTGVPVFYKAPNFIASETGSNNAIAGALVDAGGNAVPLVAGLCVLQVLGHTLQAGANAYVFNTVSKSIKKHTNAASDLGTAYAATGIIQMVYDGTQWLDLSQ